MNTLGARNKHRNGLMAMVDGKYADAAACFRDAMELERNASDAGKCTARSLSYYGVAMALSDRPTPDAIRACEMAARADRWDPDLRLNLGRVLSLAGRRTKALEAFEAGLRLNPDHPALIAERRKIDRRKPPVLRFLGRDHSLNIMLGRVRASLAKPKVQPHAVEFRRSASAPVTKAG